MAAFRRIYNFRRVVEDIYPNLARSFEDAGVRRFVELGGGRGPISALLAARGVRTCVVDLDRHMLAEACRPGVQADMVRLPLTDNCLDGAAAVNCLYFLSQPLCALHEARRVVRSGGVFVASSPSRWNDPELKGIDPGWGAASSFDAEDAPSLVAEVFGKIEVDRWRVSAYVLPDRAAIADYLHAFNVPDWEDRARRIVPPLTITKVGAHVWARA
ncbi:MAG: class I SAM-dependent methyltransferase [Candidatus Dormiibacterota bacterium]